MGDGGALLLGLLLAVSTSVVGGRADPNLQGYAGQTYFFLAPLFIPLFILGVPILDTLFAIIRRATRRQGVATADKGHLHHRLMEMGHGQRRSVVILWAWTALLSAFVLYPVLTQSFVSYVPIGGCDARAAAVHAVPPADPSEPGNSTRTTSSVWFGALEERPDRLCTRSQAPHIASDRNSTTTSAEPTPRTTR